ncbi:cbb3-type cytochrome oxidase assembly protein CcoS [Hydromonas duriensis]|uniref:Cbb3-type cytochrome oxidase maturation protein n=1 Tax=Hydromonas duriensis TaxID=1527608 RepID=A0A4R6Y975_9BURK|nr:cbb3-type cytochrome oxidase assembly protein CcoS [Hydromonas duriensis]TDR32004.1 cbb3-type cytochrome oxidase maturation protein [Hydromonas duriensis]
METLYLLIPLSVVLVFVIIWGLWWAVHQGQFDKLEKQGRSIFEDEDQTE